MSDAVGTPLPARVALPFAVFLGLAEIVRNWGDWAAWPFWMIDYIAVGLLVWGWLAAKHGRADAHARLAGAWGFTCAMFYISFFSHVYLGGSPGGPVNPRALTAISGVLFALSALVFSKCLTAKNG